MAVKYLVSGKGGTHLPYTKADGSPDHRLMGAAWAALHGGYRGNKYAGPNKQAAIDKLTAVYKSEKMAAPQESFFVPEGKDSLLYEADGVTPKSESFDALRNRVQAAIDQSVREGEDMDLDGDDDSGLGGCCCDYAWIVDLFPATVVYSMNGNLFQCEYHDDGDQVTLGTPVEVEQSYTVVASDPAREDTQESHRALARECVSLSDDGEQVTIGTRALARECVSLSESAYDATKGELTITVIKPGFSKNQTEGRQRFYPAATLKRDHKIFEGAKMFADHQTDKEAKDRPEGSVHNWVATVGKTWAESDGTVRAKVDVIDPAFKAKLDKLNEKSLLKEMGVSVRIGAEVSKARIDGQEAMSIDSILSRRSVDFVTYAGAGGQVEAMESVEGDPDNDLDLVNEAQLRERRPDLVELIESKSNPNGQEGHMKTIEQQLQESATKLAEVNATLAAEKKRADEAEAKLQESEKKEKKATAATELAKLLTESKLPAKAQERLKKQFSEADKTEGMKEAIDLERDYIKSLGASSKVTNMGEDLNGNQSSANKTGANLKESFLSLGLNEKEAEIAAVGRR